MKLATILTIAFSIACVSIRLSGNESPIWTSNLTQDALIEKARAGDTYFQAILGIYMRAGENGIKVDFDAARQWSQKAAHAGQPLGLYNLGNLALLMGEFEDSNTYYQDAQLRLTRRASEGDPVAQFAMGEICFFVTPKNPSRGIEYFRESATAGYPQAQATLGALYLKGLPPLMQQDTRKGITLLVEGARRQSMTARFNLGMAYYNGEGVPKDNNRAIRWLRLAADQNFAEAQYSLATLLLEVDPVINKHESIRLLQQAAGQHHVGASEDLRKHLGGKGTNTPQTQTPVSPSQPKPSAAQLNLGKNYRLAGQKHYNGQGTKQSFEKAYAYFRKAAELGDSEGQRYLALLLFHGKGCAQNRIEAGKWLRLAASMGDMEAKRLLTTFAHLFK